MNLKAAYLLPLLLSACVGNELQEQMPGDVELRIIPEAEATRTTLNDAYSMVWEDAKDNIGVCILHVRVETFWRNHPG